MSTTYDLIRVVNLRDEDLVLRGNTVYTIPANGERIIPFQEAASWFGDPRLQDSGRDKTRSMAWNQIQNLWGYTEGMTYLKDRWDVTAGFKTWEDFAPAVECFDMDGNQVYFIIHDPEGSQPFGGPKLLDPAFQDNEAILRQMQDMQATMAQMKELLDERGRVEDHAAVAAAQEQASFDAVNLPQPPAEDEVSDDAPKTVRTRARG